MDWGLNFIENYNGYIYLAYETPKQYQDRI